MTEVPDLARLASESGWLRALARSLVADAHLADDLAQDVLVAALEHDRPVRSWRAFFATALRRRLFEWRREGAARATRERRTSRHEALPSTLDMVARAGVQRDLVQAVLELEEPYRTAILWRFFEELPPREIARRSGAPLDTVHTRIQRGLARLRERLERTHGSDERGGWVVALAPLLSPLLSNTTRALPGAPFLPALLMKTSTQVMLAVLLLAGGALAIWPFHRAPATAGASAPEMAEAAPAHVPLDSAALPRAEPAEAVREAVPPAATPALAPAAEVAPAAPRRTVAGLALDAYGHGLAGVELVARPGGERFRSGGGGRFALELGEGTSTLESADERYATVLAGAAETTAETGAVVVLAPRLELAGRVLDEGGTGLAGAELWVRLPRGFGADFGLALDGALTRWWSAVSDPAGAFALSGVPSIDGAELSVHLGGFEPHAEALPAASRGDLVLTLARVKASDELVRGVVLLPDESPAPGARVSIGLTTTVCDARGRFELAATAETPAVRVLAVQRGFRAASATRADFGGVWPAELVLHLGGDPLAIRGRVLAPDGVPVPHARVWLADPTWFGGVEGDVTSAEALGARDDRRFWAYVESAGDGSFALEGLAPRDYRLKALDPVTLLQIESEPIAAGSVEVRLVFPADAVHERLRGRVLAPDGAGIAGVSVKVEHWVLTYDYPTGGTRDESCPGAEAVTDAEGRFELPKVPKQGAELFASGDAILFAGAEIGPGTDPDDVVIHAERRIHLQVELAPPLERADTVRVLDERGQRLLLRVMRGQTSDTNSYARLADGRSQVLSLSERARWVVLYHGEAEVARLPFAPAPSGVNTVRW